MSDTVSYYNNNAPTFFNDTVSVDMYLLHDRFLALVPKGGFVLDAGCGSGRDARAFKQRGYRVAAFDASPELAALASEYIGHYVAVRTFADVDEVGLYDGIWACASLLHLPLSELSDAINRLWRALKPGGVFYLSFKEGFGERTKDGRQFTDLNELALRRFFNGFTDLLRIECWQSTDGRPDRSDVWLNAIVRRKHHAGGRLITGGSTNPFLPSLLEGIRQATEIEMAVAFIKATGLRLLFSDLKDALAPEPESQRESARLRIITSDYLDVTDPEAMRSLMLLQERGAEVKVYESAGSSFHMKSYIFVRRNDSASVSGMAFVGSSNISRQALQDGLEWNYRIDVSKWGDSPDYAGFIEIRSRFEELFADERAVLLTHDWIDGYEQRRRVQSLPVAPGSHEIEPPPLPTSIQNEALLALTLTRQQGFRRGLVVM